ncbi:MAG: ATP-binding domain-containing protein [Thiobacillaceae bacterium]|nr:ATP-binding domain-containing protein [Thiobacillaceae bacterium]
MAKVVPDGWRELEVTGAAAREIETLAQLAEALPDTYTVYHAVHWTNLERGFSVYGEIDFVVVNRSGDLLLVEQKSGFLEETAAGLVKRYAEQTRSVPFQLARTVAAVQDKLARRPGCKGAHVDYLLYCPDYLVRRVETAGLAPGRIVDARRKAHLPALVQAALPPGEADPRAQEMHRFLRDVIQLETDVSALVGRAGALVTRVSGGLAHWARQLDFAPYRLRVVGTAGSGKTQLALAEFRDTLARGGRPLYLCFNRPLADHFEQIAPPGGWAGTLHMLCDQRLRAAGETPDFDRPDAFERLVARAAELPADEAWRFDTLIVDEGQDFSEAWRDLALGHLGPGGRALWLEDPLQNLYGRPPLPLPGWVVLRARQNYRSPRPVVRMLRSLLPEDSGVEAAGPLHDAGLEVLAYRDAAELKEKVKEGIRLCLAAGYRKSDLAVVSFRGQEQSLLFPHTQLGPHALKTFTGRYDLLGHPLYSDGEVLLETVYRFKGQAAPAIVFAEIDFEALDDKAARKLFVGATRAMMKLVLVVSERCAATLLERLG